MKQYLKSYQMKLTVLGPVFVGSGRELSKKEYMFLPGNKIGVVDIEKLYAYLQKRHKQQAFDDFLLKRPNDDLKHWIMDQRIDIKDVKPCMKYVLDSGDTSLVRGTRTSIMECVKDPYGKPYIPGSSLKGMFRTILLAADVGVNREKYNSERRTLSGAVDAKKIRTAYLSRETKQLEAKRYNTLNRKPNGKMDAVNDVMSGFIMSDSEPLSMNDIVLCQKVERHTDGTEKNLNLLRECICPGTEIHFTLTIDESICKITVNHLMNAVDTFSENYYSNFLSGFRGMDRLRPSFVYLGGGCGFVSKTIIYPMFGKRDGITIIKKIFENTGVPRVHKHNRDTERGASPHIVKCTRYQGKTLQMGLCSLSVK